MAAAEQAIAAEQEAEKTLCLQAEFQADSHQVEFQAESLVPTGHELLADWWECTGTDFAGAKVDAKDSETVHIPREAVWDSNGMTWTLQSILDTESGPPGARRRFHSEPPLKRYAGVERAKVNWAELVDLQEEEQSRAQFPHGDFPTRSCDDADRPEESAAAIPVPCDALSRSSQGLRIPGKFVADDEVWVRVDGHDYSLPWSCRAGCEKFDHIPFGLDVDRYIKVMGHDPAWDIIGKHVKYVSPSGKEEWFQKSVERRHKVCISLRGRGAGKQDLQDTRPLMVFIVPTKANSETSKVMDAKQEVLRKLKEIHDRYNTKVELLSF